jgi:hypothetical protein
MTPNEVVVARMSQVARSVITFFSLDTVLELAYIPAHG